MPTPWDEVSKAQRAIAEAQQKYPYLNRLGGPLALVQGKGPFMSESYMPNADDNPVPGHYTVELRSDKIKNNPGKWADLLGREGLDWMARQDPTYQMYAKGFRQLMTPPQLSASKRAQTRDKDTRNLEDFLKGAQIQEYLGGYLTPQAAPGWTGPQGEGQYTPVQTQMLDELKSYLFRR